MDEEFLIFLRQAEIYLVRINRYSRATYITGIKTI